MKIKDLQSLLTHELKDLYSAEKQIAKALPKMARKASDPQLKQALEQHERVTKTQIERLEKACEMIDVKPSGVKCAAMEGIIEEGKKIMEENLPDDVMDAALIGAAQRVEHYEIAGYGTARTYARRLGHNDLARLLQTTLDEEGATDKKLTQIAESHVNREAIGAGAR